MLKNFIVAGLIAAGVAFVPCTDAAAASHVLGVNEEEWSQDLSVIGGSYVFSDTFIDEVKESQKGLENKYGSEHFEKLNSRKETLREKHRKNSLLQMRSQPSRSSFVLDLSLDKNRYRKLLNYIPALGTYYGEHHIAKMLPYIAFCLNYDVKTSELDSILEEFLRRETPIDIACERLFRLAKKNI